MCATGHQHAHTSAWRAPTRTTDGMVLARGQMPEAAFALPVRELLSAICEGEEATYFFLMQRIDASLEEAHVLRAHHKQLGNILKEVVAMIVGRWKWMPGSQQELNQACNEFDAGWETL